MPNIIIMDDDSDTLELYKNIFSRVLNSLSYEGKTKEKRKEETVEYDTDAEISDVFYCDNSIDTVNYVKNAIDTNNPFAAAFLDIRMEGQEDGIWVGEQLRKMDPEIELVFVTAYSEYDPKEIVTRVSPVHKMMYLQKPFSVHELLHLAHSLVHKWSKERSDRILRETLHKLVEEKTRDLKIANEILEKKVEERTSYLEEMNSALKILLQQREEDKKKIGETILRNTRQLIKPMVDKLKMTNISQRQGNILTTLETNLDQITNPFLKTLDAAYITLTPMEIQVANHVKAGLANKEIAELLGVSKGTITIHRHNLRKKLGILNKKINLRTHLLSLE